MEGRNHILSLRTRVEQGEFYTDPVWERIVHEGSPSDTANTASDTANTACSTSLKMNPITST